MADWLLLVPPRGAPAALPDPAALARSLRGAGPHAVRRTDVDGALFFTVAETSEDPGVVTTQCDGRAQCAVTASALLTEREELVDSLRADGRHVHLASPDGLLIAEAVCEWREDAWARPGGEFSVAAWLPD